MTTEDITTFCDNMKRSLIEASERGDAIYIGRKSDTEPITSGFDGYGANIVDAMYMGETITIAHGRPAEIAIARRQKHPAMEYCSPARKPAAPPFPHP